MIKLKELITEGGAYGHLAHPFELDINLTFGQLKDIINKGLSGELKLSREKTDGMNITVSWKGGKLIAARTKTHLQNKGQNALSVTDVANKFKGRGDVEKAFNLAMKDLTNAISKLSEKQRNKIFDEGGKFMSLEIIYPESTNVILYGQPLLVFHGTLSYDESGNPIGEDPQSGRILAGMIKQINQNIQSTFTIRDQPTIQLPKNKNLDKLKPKYLSMVSKLQSEYKLKDGDGVTEYHKEWWREYIQKHSPKKLDNSTINGLVNRWALDDKSFRLDIKNIEDVSALEWAKRVDKTDLNKLRKDNFIKFENIFLGVGADILSFISSALVVNPDKTIQSIRQRIESTISTIRKSGDSKAIDKLELELQRIENIGGLDRLVPVEGIVFVYNGIPMKLSGLFAPINQLLGIMYRN
jgi:hypothetical protein